MLLPLEELIGISDDHQKLDPLLYVVLIGLLVLPDLFLNTFLLLSPQVNMSFIKCFFDLPIQLVQIHLIDPVLEL